MNRINIILTLSLVINGYFLWGKMSVPDKSGFSDSESLVAQGEAVAHASSSRLSPSTPDSSTTPVPASGQKPNAMVVVHDSNNQEGEGYREDTVDESDFIRSMHKRDLQRLTDHLPKSVLDLLPSRPKDYAAVKDVLLDRFTYGYPSGVDELQDHLEVAKALMKASDIALRDAMRGGEEYVDDPNTEMQTFIVDKLLEQIQIFPDESAAIMEAAYEIGIQPSQANSVIPLLGSSDPSVSSHAIYAAFDILYEMKNSRAETTEPHKEDVSRMYDQLKLFITQNPDAFIDMML